MTGRYATQKCEGCETIIHVHSDHADAPIFHPECPEWGYGDHPVFLPPDHPHWADVEEGGDACPACEEPPAHRNGEYGYICGTDNCGVNFYTPDP